MAASPRSHSRDLLHWQHICDIHARTHARTHGRRTFSKTNVCRDGNIYNYDIYNKYTSLASRNDRYYYCNYCSEARDRLLLWRKRTGSTDDMDYWGRREKKTKKKSLPLALSRSLRSLCVHILIYTTKYLFNSDAG